MFKRFKRDIRAQQYFTTAEEAMFFEQAAKEVAAGEIQAGLHAMALSKCEGDEVKANAMYLQLRVDMLKQEAAVGEKILEAAEREQAQLDQEQRQREQEQSRRDDEKAREAARQASFESDDSGLLYISNFMLFIAIIVAIALGVAATHPS